MIRSRWLACSVAAIILLVSWSCRSDDSDQGREASWRGATILISLDGFRWDYRVQFQTPTLDELASRGVVANLRPPVPTKTFPAHHSIATGRWPNQHGVVGNTMYDPDLDDRFSMGDEDAVSDGRWWGGEPIWVTAEKSGLITATYFWPGTEAEIDGIRPSFWKAYDGDVPNEARVDQVLEWLDLPAERRPSFLTLYFSDVDGAGHRHGPLSTQTREAVERVDRHLGRFVDGLNARNLDDSVNFVVVSDHGMSQLSRDRLVFIDEYIDVDRAGVLSLGQYVALWPQDTSEVDLMFEALHEAHDALTVYRRGKIPERFHLDGHPRTPPIVGMVEEGWSISTREWVDRREDAFTGGGHGYDNHVPDMIGLFVAAGPAFQTDVSAGTLDAVDVYNLLAASLGIEPAPNDGNIRVSEKILNPDVTEP